MKKITLLIFLAFFDCGDESEIYSYTIKNESGHFITVEGYYTDCCPSLVIVYHYFENGELLTKTYLDENSPSKGFSFSLFFGENGLENKIVDSIKVTYDNSKVSFFYPEKIDEISNERNPLGRYYNRGNTEETFIFTKQDYENAEDCNGSCE